MVGATLSTALYGACSIGLGIASTLWTVNHPLLSALPSLDVVLFMSLLRLGSLDPVLLLPTK